MNFYFLIATHIYSMAEIIFISMFLSGSFYVVFQLTFLLVYWAFRASTSAQMQVGALPELTVLRTNNANLCVAILKYHF